MSCGCQAHTENSTFMHFDSNRKVFWYEIPRNASSSVRKNLLGIQEYREDKCTPDTGQQWARKNGFRQFAVIRDPFERVLSMLEVFERLPPRREAVFLTEARMSYDTFVHNLRFHYDHHCEPQTVFLPKDLSDDTLIRLESFDKDWNSFFSNEANPPPTKRWGTRKACGNLNLSCKEETIEMILKLYKNDFEVLGYSKDLQR